MSDLLIPFEADGSVPNSPLKDEAYSWKRNFVFKDTLFFESHIRGSSRCGVAVRASSRARYYMFIVDVLFALAHGRVEFGRMHGTWTFVRRGPAFGVRLVTDSA